MRGRADEPDSLGQFWDELVQSGEPADDAAGVIDRGMTDVVRGLHAMDETPGPPPELVQRMWTDALRLATGAPLGVPAHLNGHHPATRTSRMQRMLFWLVPALATLAATMAAGFIAGAVVGGVGSRLIMRLAASMTSARNEGLITEAGNRVGELSAGGTAVLIFFAALMGAAIAPLYLAVRSLLPENGRIRGLLFGVIIFSVGGADVLEHGRNPDYRQFGIAGLNVCLFSLLPVLYGMSVVPLADRWSARAVRWCPRIAGWIAIALMLPIASQVVLFFIFGAIEQPWLALLFLPAAVRGLARVELPRWVPRVGRLPDPWPRLATYGAVAVPCLFGMIQVAVSIDRILS